jgi:predicted SPOUT superfamily RNA methylase MTH1
MHPNLRYAGLLPSLDMPHHKTADLSLPYFEGITVEAARYGNGYGNYEEEAKRRKKEKKKGKKDHTMTFQDQGKTVHVQAGLKEPLAVTVYTDIALSTRVTLKRNQDFEISADDDFLVEPVPNEAPRREAGYYWGYQVRRVKRLSSVFKKCPFVEKGKYTLTIGTSERGIPVEKANLEISKALETKTNAQHILIVFGGVGGLEVAVKNDPKLVEKKITSAKSLFDYWVDLCPGQGSRTIRTEEAVWIGLMGLRGICTKYLK